MNLEQNIGENKYKHIYVFGCSHSLSTNSIDNTCKSYPEHLAEKLNIPIENVYNYSINGSSNNENLYYLNCVNLELTFYHPMNDVRSQIYNEILPTIIYDDSLIIFQMTYWHRNTFQHTFEKKNGFYKLIPILQHSKNEDGDITKFNQIYFTKLSNTLFLQRNSVLPIYYTLKGIEIERTNVSTLLLSWDNIDDTNIQKYITKELTNIQDFIINNEWTCDSEIKNKDIHLSPTGHRLFGEYLLKYITH